MCSMAPLRSHVLAPCIACDVIRSSPPHPLITTHTTRNFCTGDDKNFLAINTMCSDEASPHRPWCMMIVGKSLTFSLSASIGLLSAQIPVLTVSAAVGTGIAAAAADDDDDDNGDDDGDDVEYVDDACDRVIQSNATRPPSSKVNNSRSKTTFPDKIKYCAPMLRMRN